jgi:hypothetical protein
VSESHGNVGHFQTNKEFSKEKLEKACGIHNMVRCPIGVITVTHGIELFGRGIGILRIVSCDEGSPI